MKRALLVLALAALAFPAIVLGKGPTRATLDGPGLAHPITFKGYGTGRRSVGTLSEQAGFFPASFGQQPSPMLSRRPAGRLGPRYTATYIVPGPNGGNDHLRQDVYPFASPRPLTYMKPGQRFFGTERTRGGWFRAAAGFKRMLMRAGVPAP